MRTVTSLMLVLGVCAAAAACGGSSEVSPASETPEGGEGGGDAKGGNGGSSGKGGSSSKGGSSGKGGSGGNGGSGGDSSGLGGVAGEPGGVGGDGGLPAGGVGGVGATGGVSGSGDGGVSGVSGEGGVSGDSGGVGGNAGEPGPGSLRIIISRPAGADPVSVEIEGPNFDQTIARSAIFSDLDAGEYVVQAGSARVPGPVVSAVYDAVVRDTPATVVDGAQTSVSVIYPFQRGGTGRLWATDYGNGFVSAFDAERLNAASSDIGDLVLSVEGAPRASTAIAFDSEGNAWIGDCIAGDIVKIPPSELGGSGTSTVTPSVIIGRPDGTWSTCVVSLEFDSEGALYAAYNANRVVKYTPDQLLASANPGTPAVIIRSASFGSLQDATFDDDGNLWLSAYSAAIVSKLTPAQLQTSNDALAPAASWSVPEAEGLAMGPDGNLWVATYDNQVRAYDPTAVTLPAPSRSITLPDGFGPVGIAFDESGNLWAISFNFGTIIRINAADLTTDGAKTPAFEFTNTGMLSGAALVFNPAP